MRKSAALCSLLSAYLRIVRTRSCLSTRTWRRGRGRRSRRRSKRRWKREEEPPSDEKEEAPTPEQAEFGMEDVLTEFELSQAEEAMKQQVALESIQFEAAVEGNRRFLHKADMELEQSFAAEEDYKEARAFCLSANVHEAGDSGTNIIGISDDE